MRRNRQALLLVAVASAAVVLVLRALLARRQQPGEGGVITHEIRDLIATLQAPLAALTGPDGQPAAHVATPWAIAALLAAVLLAAAFAWIRRRAQQRDRSRFS